MSHDSYDVLREYHNLLGVEFGSDSDQLKSGYKKMALKFHPDKTNGDKHGSAIFLKIQEAYEALKDPGNRKYIEHSDEVVAQRRRKELYDSMQVDIQRLQRQKQEALMTYKTARENLEQVKENYERRKRERDEREQQEQEEREEREREEREERELEEQREQQELEEQREQQEREDREREREAKRQLKRERDNLRKREKRRQQREERERQWAELQRQELEAAELLEREREQRKRKREDRDRYELEHPTLVKRVAALEFELKQRTDALIAIDTALQCAICCDRFSSNGPSTMAICGHAVHTACHEKQKTHGTANVCAECRAPVYDFFEFRGFTAISDAINQLEAALELA